MEQDPVCRGFIDVSVCATLYYHGGIACSYSHTVSGHRPQVTSHRRAPGLVHHTDIHSYFAHHGEQDGLLC
jgi:hypothetical protein